MPQPPMPCRSRRAARAVAVGVAAVLSGCLTFGVTAPGAFGQAAAAPAAAAQPAIKIVKAGSRGESVRDVQRALGVRVTGVYDRATAKAVRRFQQRKRLTVDGQVGPATRAALGLGTGTAADTSTTAPAPDAAQTLAALAACESGGDPAAVSPDGRYRGKYQFSRETWAAMGGTGDPAQAPEAEQDARAAALLAAQGLAPWPACSGALTAA